MRVRVHVCASVKYIYILPVYTRPLPGPQVFVCDPRVYVLTLARVIGIYLVCVRVKEDIQVERGKRRGYDSVVAMPRYWSRRAGGCT